MPAVITPLLAILVALGLLGSGASGQFSPPFRFDGFPPPEPTRSTSSSPSAAATATGSNADSEGPTSTSSNNNNSSLIWQPLRATFRPLNRPATPTPPAPPVPLALSLGTEPISPPSAASPSASEFSSSPVGGGDTSSGELANNGNGNTFVAAGQPPTPAPVSIAAAAAAARDRDSLDSEDLPTRVPLTRFRPTKAPSSDPQAQPAAPLTAGAMTTLALSAASRSHKLSQQRNGTMGHITSECLECLCEASTNCNAQSRCQTSDVRHTRCGMFLISYDQWLETGLSRELVTAEALSADAAADERAFYECVTNRDCAERLLTIYAQRHAKDCDKDGRIDCYDMAAVHQGGLEGCASEALLDSQYWSDFNACFGFGR